MNDRVKPVSGAAQFVYVKDRQATQATERDQQIHSHFRDDNSNFDIAVCNKRSDQSEAGNHH